MQQLREARPLRGLVIRRRRPHRHAKAGRSPLVPVQPPMGLPELRLPALHRGTVRPRRTLRWVDPLCAASRTAVEPDRAIAYAARDHPVLTWEEAEQPARDAPGSEAGARAPRAFRLALGHSTSLVPRRAGGQPFRGRSSGARSKQSVVMPATLKDDRDARNDQRGDKDPDGVHRFVPPFLLEAMDRQTW